MSAEGMFDVQKFRDYVLGVDGERWADAVPDLVIADEIGQAKAMVEISGKRRGWLGIVHGRLKPVYANAAASGGGGDDA